MSGNIWVLAEQWKGQLAEITFELLALGREVADELSAPLQAVVLGHEARGLCEPLGLADSVFYVDHPALKEPTPEVYAKALVELVRDRQPAAVLIALSNVSMGVGTLVGEELEAPVINFCRDLCVRDGRLEAHCVLYAGKINARVTAAREPVILGVWPGARSPEKGRSQKKPEVEDLAVSLPDAPPVLLKRYIEPEAGDVDLTKQAVLVAVGRGIQSQDNLELAEAVAGALGGAVCGSRPVIDQGWLPLSRQIGKSGLAVKPKLYLAAGISGAPEHVEGMKDSELIIAINSDPQAPIFSVAHYGIVADALDVLPALADAIQARR